MPKDFEPFLQDPKNFSDFVAPTSKPAKEFKKGKITNFEFFFIVCSR
jgi:hypothetical protein